MTKTYLGIDYGAKRVGLARGDSETKFAAAFKTISPSDLLKVIISEGPFDLLVVGLPRSLDGSDTPQTLAVKRFMYDLLGDLDQEIVFQDEAATSSMAEDRLRESGRHFEREEIDAEAASIILQDYLDSL